MCKNYECVRPQLSSDEIEQTNQFLHYLFVTFSRGQTDETRNEHTMKIIQREEERRDSVLF